MLSRAAIKTRRIYALAGVSLSALLVANSSALAETFWNGGYSTDWFDANNWVWDGVVPQAGSTARIDIGTNIPVIGSGDSAMAATLYLGVSTGAGLTVAGSLLTNTTNFGFQASGNGTVTIEAGGTWENTGVVVVGDTGTGTINVNGELKSTNAILGGGGPGNLGTGTVTLDGADASWEDTGRIIVGNYGTGSVTIKNGASLQTSGGLVGSQSTGTGTVTIDGGSWTASGDGDAGRGVIQIGNEGDGELFVSAGGTISSVDGYVGSENHSEGTAIISGEGSSWSNSRDLFVAHNNGSIGHLTIEDQASVDARFVQIGNLAGSTGTVDVTGAGSTLTAREDLNVGWHGNGTLNVLDGATVSATSSSYQLLIANEFDATGTALVSGSGSELSTAYRLIVGGAGAGTLTVQNGGKISATDQIRIARAAGSTGTLIIGAAEGDNAVAAGTIDTPTIRFGNGDGKVVFNATNTDYVLSSRIIGAGVIEIYNGTLNLTASDNTYSGGTKVYGGTLALANSTAAGTGAITLENGATLAYATGIDVQNDLVINGLVDLSVASGTATQSGDVTLGQNAMWHLQGDGTLRFTGHTTSASGAVNVSDNAVLSVNGTMSSALTVGNLGTLKGTGVVGTTTIQAGGTIAPGNSIGTINVAGDITFDAGSIYEVETDPTGANDRIVATGTAFLNGGTVKVDPASGVYAPNTSYTILSANLVDGKFADPTSSLAFLTPVLSYDAQNVYLRLDRNSATFSGIGQTENQITAGLSVDSTSNLTIPNALTGLTTADALAALDALSGELHATASGLRLLQSQLPRQAILDRLDAAANDIGSAMPLGYAAAPAVAAEPLEQNTAWASVYGLRQDLDGDGNAASAAASSGGLAAGAETELNDWRIGIMMHAGMSAVDVADRQSSADSTDYGLGLYAGTSWGQTHLALGMAYTRHDISTRRDVRFPGFVDTLEASYSSGTAQAFGQIKHDIELGAATISPFAGFALVNESTSAFSETGGAAALDVGAASNNAMFLTIGVEGDYDVALADGTLMTATGSIGWVHAIADTPTSPNALNAGQAFAVAGTALPANALQLGAGVSFDTPSGFDFGINYNGQFSSQSSGHSFKASLSGKF